MSVAFLAAKVSMLACKDFRYVSIPLDAAGSMAFGSPNHSILNAAWISALSTSAGMDVT